MPGYYAVNVELDDSLAVGASVHTSIAPYYPGLYAMPYNVLAAWLSDSKYVLTQSSLNYRIAGSPIIAAHLQNIKISPRAANIIVHGQLLGTSGVITYTNGNDCARPVWIWLQGAGGAGGWGGSAPSGGGGGSGFPAFDRVTLQPGDTLTVVCNYSSGAMSAAIELDYDNTHKAYSVDQASLKSPGSSWVITAAPGGNGGAGDGGVGFRRGGKDEGGNGEGCIANSWVGDGQYYPPATVYCPVMNNAEGGSGGASLWASGGSGARPSKYSSASAGTYGSGGGGGYYSNYPPASGGPGFCRVLI